MRPYLFFKILEKFLLSFLSNDFIHNCAEISYIYKQHYDTPVTKLFRLAKLSDWK